MRRAESGDLCGRHRLPDRASRTYSVPEVDTHDPKVGQPGEAKLRSHTAGFVFGPTHHVRIIDPPFLLYLRMLAEVPDPRAVCR